MTLAVARRPQSGETRSRVLKFDVRRRDGRRRSTDERQLHLHDRRSSRVPDLADPRDARPRITSTSLRSSAPCTVRTSRSMTRATCSTSFAMVGRVACSRPADSSPGREYSRRTASREVFDGIVPSRRRRRRWHAASRRRRRVCRADGLQVLVVPGCRDAEVQALTVPRFVEVLFWGARSPLAFGLGSVSLVMKRTRSALRSKCCTITSDRQN